MPFSFFSALSGLHASSDSLSVTGNNIANANTTAFKRGQMNFSDLFVNSLGARLNGAGSSIQIGTGVSSKATTNYAQGNLTDSGSSTTAGIQGNGFFVVEDAAGNQNYTRAGDFVVDKDGYLVTPGGAHVQGFGAVDGSIPADAQLTDMRVQLGQMMPPVETTEATYRMNLNTSDPDGTVFHAPSTVYDSKGVAHALDLTFTKQPDGSFMMDATLDGNPTMLNVDGGGPAAGPIPVTFDANGQLATPATSLAIEPDQTLLNGATLASIDVPLRQTNPDGTAGPSNFTNYESTSGVALTAQNGAAAGAIRGIEIAGDGSGLVYAVADNGQLRAVGQLALANFGSVEGLNHLGGNLYQATAGSGQASIGTPNSGGRGAIVGGTVEASNVDITNEFIDLIVAQRSFQANSRVVTTINQVLQDLIQSV